MRALAMSTEAIIVTVAFMFVLATLLIYVDRLVGPDPVSQPLSNEGRDALIALGYSMILGGGAASDPAAALDKLDMQLSNALKLIASYYPAGRIAIHIDAYQYGAYDEPVLEKVMGSPTVTRIDQFTYSGAYVFTVVDINSLTPSFYIVEVNASRAR